MEKNFEKTLKIQNQEKDVRKMHLLSNNVRGTIFEKDLTDTYEKNVHWKRNLFFVCALRRGKSM